MSSQPAKSSRPDGPRPTSERSVSSVPKPGGVKARLHVVKGSEHWVDQALEDFERAMIRQDRSPSTIRAYRWALEDLFNGMKIAGKRSVEDVDREVLEDWQDTMIERGMKPRSRGLAASAAKQFIRWAADQGWLDYRAEKALVRVKAPPLRPRPIAPDDLEALKRFLLPRRPRMSLVALRDRALFFYYLTTGARSSEVLQVRRDDITAPVVRQKGGSEKTLMLPESTLEMVRDYLRGRRDDQPWLWVTHKTNAPTLRLQPAGVREVWRKLARKVGIPLFTTHQIRHTCATELLAAGVPELVVAEHLGHHGLASLHIYGQVREPARRQAVEVMAELTKGPRPLTFPKTKRRGRY